MNRIAIVLVTVAICTSPTVARADDDVPDGAEPAAPATPEGVADESVSAGTAIDPSSSVTVMPAATAPPGDGVVATAVPRIPYRNAISVQLATIDTSGVAILGEHLLQRPSF